MTVKALYEKGKNELEKAGVETPAFEALCLFEKAFGIRGRAYLTVHGGEACLPEKEAEFLALAGRRAAGEPLQYLLGEWDFLSLTLAVRPGVLIPRPETELLCETAAEELKKSGGRRLLDLCAGTGAVGLGVCALLPEAEALCVELYEEPLACLRENIARYPAYRVQAAKGDVLKGEPETEGLFDALVSNPPYIAEGEMASLQKEVLREPREALCGGADGLLFYRAILRHFRNRVRPGGAVAFEIGEDQGAAVSALMREAGLEQVRIRRDAAGLDRVVCGTAI